MKKKQLTRINLCMGTIMLMLVLTSWMGGKAVSLYGGITDCCVNTSDIGVLATNGDTDMRLAVVEPEITWKEASKLIIEEFSDLGVGVTKQALDVAYCESKWKPEAKNTNTNGSTDHSIFQVNSVWKKLYGMDRIQDPKENIKIAKEIYLRNKSWSPWVCSRILKLR